jgi:phosphoserine phosphatase RsbU/P
MALNLPARRASVVDVLRILLVEDNPGDARLIREHLADVASTAYHLTHAQDLADGLATLTTAATTFDAVLLDLSLPDGEGLGNILRLRAEAPQVPVVVLTGLDDEDLALQALQVGAQDYLVKGRVRGTEIDKALRYARERRRCEAMVHQQDLAARDAELRERFIGILGHDLRNPLNTIMVSAAVLETTMGRAEDDRQRLALQRISTSTRRMARMIDDLLDFTRARLGGGFPIQLASCDLAALCQQVTDELLGARPDARIDLSREGDCAGSWDVDRLAQVISNLTANALDHGNGDQPVSVHVDGRRQDVLRVEVVNHGPRIPPEVLPHIFEAFRRAGADTRERSSGLGLGLFIARQIVQAHGGDISIDSDDHATRFTVVLPRHPHVPA